jgi:hypothetical protein
LNTFSIAEKPAAKIADQSIVPTDATGESLHNPQTNVTIFETTVGVGRVAVSSRWNPATSPEDHFPRDSLPFLTHAAYRRICYTTRRKGIRLIAPAESSMMSGSLLMIPST